MFPARAAGSRVLQLQRSVWFSPPARRHVHPRPVILLDTATGICGGITADVSWIYGAVSEGTRKLKQTEFGGPFIVLRSSSNMAVPSMLARRETSEWTSMFNDHYFIIFPLISFHL